MIKINDRAPTYVAQLQEAVRQYNAYQWTSAILMWTTLGR